jgi:hypothetical protein
VGSWVALGPLQSFFHLKSPFFRKNSLFNCTILPFQHAPLQLLAMLEVREREQVALVTVVHDYLQHVEAQEVGSSGSGDEHSSPPVEGMAAVEDEEHEQRWRDTVQKWSHRLAAWGEEGSAVMRGWEAGEEQGAPLRRVTPRSLEDALNSIASCKAPAPSGDRVVAAAVPPGAKPSEHGAPTPQAAPLNLHDKFRAARSSPEPYENPTYSPVPFANPTFSPASSPGRVGMATKKSHSRLSTPKIDYGGMLKPNRMLCML